MLALYDAGINIRMISTSEIKISVLRRRDMTAVGGYDIIF
ncbi:MAG: ACT domain-containing protein [Oscillospiraceae bacterium]